MEEDVECRVGWNPELIARRAGTRTLLAGPGPPPHGHAVTASVIFSLALMSRRHEFLLQVDRATSKVQVKVNLKSSPCSLSSDQVQRAHHRRGCAPHRRRLRRAAFLRA